MTTTEHDIPAAAGPKLRMTEEEFVAWATEDVRAEWVDGEVILMPPTSFDHSAVVTWLSILMGMHTSKHDLGTLTGPEFTARLHKRRRVPDILFIAKNRQSIIQKNHAEGGPDLIVEVVSPDSQSRDRRDKYLEYQAAGVREYWVIDPASANAEFYGLQNAAFVQLPELDGIFRSPVLEGFWLRTEWLWQNPLPNTYEIAKVIGIF